MDLTLFRIKLARAIYWRNTDDKKTFPHLTSAETHFIAVLTDDCLLCSYVLLHQHSAVSGMDGLQNYMIKVDPQDGDSPITFNVDPKALFPQFEQEIQETKEDFLLRSVIATTIIILLSSVCTYFLTKKTLTPLQKLTSEVSQIQAQNLSTQLASDSSSNQTALKTGTTVLNSIQDSRDSLSGVSWMKKQPI